MKRTPKLFEYNFSEQSLDSLTPANPTQPQPLTLKALRGNLTLPCNAVSAVHLVHRVLLTLFSF